MLHNVLVYAALVPISFLCSLIFYKNTYQDFVQWWNAEGDSWFVLAYVALVFIAMEKGYFHSV